MKWQKKPVVIDAEVYHLGMEDGFCLPPHAMPNGATNPDSRDTAFVAYIDTLEGRFLINEGDYIITDADGKRIVCKGAIFLKLYEREDE